MNHPDMNHPDIDRRELKRLFRLFLLTLNDLDADDWYDTDRGIAKFTLEQFDKWLKKYQAKKVEAQDKM